MFNPIFLIFKAHILVPKVYIGIVNNEHKCKK